LRAVRGGEGCGGEGCGGSGGVRYGGEGCGGEGCGGEGCDGEGGGEGGREGSECSCRDTHAHGVSRASSGDACESRVVGVRDGMGIRPEFTGARGAPKQADSISLKE
jgi:hypothetical protein